MDMDLSDLLAALQTAARSVGAEVASPWFYLQLGLVLAGAGLAFAASAAVRARVDSGCGDKQAARVGALRNVFDHMARARTREDGRGQLA